MRTMLGQHFLMHGQIAERIVKTAEIGRDSIVLEIGPGGGILTRELLRKASKVIAVETDQKLFEKLQSDFAIEILSGRLELIYGDIRAFDISNLPKNYVLVANIPYYLTGEILKTFLTTNHQPLSMTLLVQKEVAERIARDKKESILSLSVKVYGTPKYEFTVPRGAFKPAPKVNSAVLTIRDISRKNFRSMAEERRFFKLIHSGFAHKRKLVQNNLAGMVSFKHLPKKVRAEDLRLVDWLDLIHCPV